MGGNAGMKDMIEVVNKLQDSFTQLGINHSYELPQIAVIGGQSAGKSSVLESFVGKDFLPRGNGVVTRRPLILQLIHNPSEEYGEFVHSPKNFTNFDEICNEILIETRRETGTNNGISARPINLKIYSPNVLTLTLIDLPGITRIPVGDQPDDIEAQINSMILTYIEQPTCLILAVTSGTQDLATSDALKLARQVDPDGNRTIGVITKLDLMDDGTDALDILQGYHLPLKRGYVGVVNRSQRDTEAKLSIEAALEAEDAYFRRHPKYSAIADHSGSRFLQKLLNKELNEHIRTTLPDLRLHLQEKLAEVETKLDEFVPIIPESVSVPKLLMEFINGLRDHFELEIGRSSSVKVNTSKLEGGAKINKLLNDEYPKRVNSMLLMNEELMGEIAMAIQNVHGVYIGMFTPDMAFEAVIRKQIARFQEPSLDCIDRVSYELEQIIQNCVAKLHAFPKLRAAVQSIINQHIKVCQKEAKLRLKYMVEVQSAYMNTLHEDFVGIHEMQKSQPSYDDRNGQNRSVADLTSMSSTQFKERSGYVTFHQKSDATAPVPPTKYWFKVTWDVLSWYKDNTETNKIGMIAGLHDMYLKADSAKSLTIAPLRGGKEIQLLFEETKDITEWTTSLVSAGVRPNNTNGGSRSVSPSPQMVPLRNTPGNRQSVMIPPGAALGSAGAANIPPDMITPVEIIRKLVDSYVSILKKTFKDYMPKIVMHSMINSIRHFISSELHVELRDHGEEKELMTGDPKVELRQRDLLLRKAAINSAIHFIDEPTQHY